VTDATNNVAGDPALPTTTDVAISLEEPSVSDYAHSEGVIEVAGLTGTFNHWQAGKIDFEQLADVFDAWWSDDSVA